MRIVLRSVAIDFEVEIDTGLWGRARYLARQHGWRPAETEPPTGAAGIGWIGTYDRPIGQVVSGSDARALAKSLGAVNGGEFTLGEVDTLLQLRWLCDEGAFSIEDPLADRLAS